MVPGPQPPSPPSVNSKNGTGSDPSAERKGHESVKKSTSEHRRKKNNKKLLGHERLKSQPPIHPSPTNDNHQIQAPRAKHRKPPYDSI